jgi:diaminopimelate epimerase
MQIEFCKYCGCGNDFVLVDNRQERLPQAISPLAARLCNRQFGVGADGLILLENSEKADFAMRIFNADGSEAEMCGNGIRCLFRFLKKLGIGSDSLEIETKERILHLASEGELIAVQMGNPTEIRWNLQLELDSSNICLHHINTGVPHIVYFVENIDEVDVKRLGKSLRYHQAFSPKGANANFASVKQDTIFLRTYERGVENETLACGTGATAAALAAAKNYGLRSPIKVSLRSKEQLSIRFSYDGVKETFSNVYMIGDAHFIFEGIAEIHPHRTSD